MARWRGVVLEPPANGADIPATSAEERQPPAEFPSLPRRQGCRRYAPLHHGQAGSGPPALCLGVLTGREIGQTDDIPADRRSPELREIATTMHVYETSLVYSLIRLGEDYPLNSPAKIIDYMQGAFADAPLQESFWIICLDRKSKPISRTRITLGTLTATLVEPREVFRIAILASAAAIIVVHNHPSGDPQPSSADTAATRQLREAANIMRIDLLDHVIIGEPCYDPTGRGYFSYAEHGIL